MTGVVLMHGWGFDATAWAAWTADALSCGPVLALDAGYTGGPCLALPQGPDAPDEWIGIGHSMGFVRLLQFPLRWRALVGIGGFLRFCAHTPGAAGTPPQTLDTMLARLEADPHDVLRRFRRRCGLRDDTPELDGNAIAGPGLERLRADLLVLRDLDQAPPAHTPPVLLLHAEDDRIAPPALAEEAQRRLPDARLLLLPSGGHALPFAHPETCMDQCREFLREHS